MNTTPLEQLLDIFNVHALGEGDVHAGTNVLIAICASVANLYPPGSALVTPDGHRLTVGISMVTAGGLTPSIVRDSVLNPLAIFQNNLGDQIAAEAAHAEALDAQLPESQRGRPRRKPSETSPALAELQTALDGLVVSRDSSDFGALVTPSCDRGLHEIVTNPAVVIDARDTITLERQLLQSHRNYPFVRASLQSESQTAALDGALMSIVVGTSVSTPGSAPRHIRGHVAATCSMARLAEAVEQGDDCFLSNVVWLVDGLGGVAASPPSGRTATTPRYKTHLLYDEALKTAWACRLDHRRTTPPEVRYAWEPGQHQWVAFLRQHEGPCPGLIAAARPLFGTLMFGLLHLCHQGGERLGWDDVGVLELAKWVVGRMVDCRERLRHTARDRELMEIAIRLVSKLEARPLNPRDLTRKTHKLAIADCRDALQVMMRLGMVRTIGDGECELIHPASQAIATIKTLCLDV